MPDTWVVVAEASRARIFAARGLDGARLEELESFVHPASRAHDGELSADRPGRSFDSATPARHDMGQRVSPQEAEWLRFAKELAARLETARQAGAVDTLYVAAAPRFLGLLRAEFSAPLRGLVAHELHKNLVREKPEEIRRHFPKSL